MGYSTQSTRPLHIRPIVRVLAIIKEQVISLPLELGREYIKVGAAITTALAGSLRGPEVFMLDLGGYLEAHPSR